jgi:hypothetical protein
MWLLRKYLFFLMINHILTDCSPDHLSVFYTKKAPVYKVQFTRKNMVLAASGFLP